MLILLTAAGGFLLCWLLLAQDAAETRISPSRQTSVFIPLADRKPPGGFMAASGGKKPRKREPFAVFQHPDGQRTESRRMEDPHSLRQDTFTGDGKLQEVRIFKVDTEGRLRSGVIYDGKEKPLGSAKYLYGQATSQPQVEEIFDRKGRLVRRLFYPGTLKDPEFTGRLVAFSPVPGKPGERNEEIQNPVQPIAPVTESGQDFTPFPVQIRREGL